MAWRSVASVLVMIVGGLLLTLLIGLLSPLGVRPAWSNHKEKS